MGTYGLVGVVLLYHGLAWLYIISLHAANKELLKLTPDEDQMRESIREEIKKEFEHELRVMDKECEREKKRLVDGCKMKIDTITKGYKRDIDELQTALADAIIENEKHAPKEKTQAEKEAVLTILRKTKIQIRALEREWKELQSIQRAIQPKSQKTAGLYSSHRIQ